jgi:hypothetical protein
MRVREIQSGEKKRNEDPYTIDDAAEGAKSEDFAKEHRVVLETGGVPDAIVGVQYLMEA